MSAMPPTRAAALVAALAGCGDTGPDGTPITDEYVRLIGADWTLAAGREDYVCATRTLTEFGDFWASGLGTGELVPGATARGPRCASRSS
jgi:hypothetical protein